MDGTEPRIPDNSRVRLRGHIGPEFYSGLAKTGNEGWIRKHRFDRNGLPECWIEWDREHWADNMQPDQWTYEEHFDVIEEGKPMSDNEQFSPHEMEMMKAFVRMMREGDEGQPSVPVEPEVTDLEAEQMAYHTGQQQRVKDLLETGDVEAFSFISVSRKPDEELPKGALVLNLASSSLNPETHSLLGMQISSVAAEFHKDAALTLIHHFTTDGDEDGDHSS